MPRAFVDGVVLTKPGERRVRLSHKMALVWALCNGSSWDDVARESCDRAKTVSVYRELTKATCFQMIDQLVDAKLIEEV